MLHSGEVPVTYSVIRSSAVFAIQGLLKYGSPFHSRKFRFSEIDSEANFESNLGLP